MSRHQNKLWKAFTLEQNNTVNMPEAWQKNIARASRHPLKVKKVYGLILKNLKKLVAKKWKALTVLKIHIGKEV